MGRRASRFWGVPDVPDKQDLVVELAHKLNAPIVHALRGKEHLEFDNPFDVGMTGLVGFASGYWAMKSCKVLLMLGTDFPYRQFYPDGARIAQVDVRPDALGNRCSLDLGVVGSVGDTVRALLPRIYKKEDATHLDKALADYHRPPGLTSTRWRRAVPTARSSTSNT